jgi:chemotaxis protein methyltransferase CheR
MSARAFDQLRGLIHRHSRIHLSPNKVELLTSRLGKRRRELGLPDWEDYVAWVESHSQEEVEVLIDLVSTNHTHFFREAIHFDILTSDLLGKLLSQSPTAQRGLRFWSAGCSSGEEAFTLAIVLAEYARQKQPDLRWQIDATDVSNRALAAARQAIYETDRLRLPEPRLLKQYFRKGTGPYEGFSKVKTELVEKIRFERLNLFGERYGIATPQHVVFCRNVLIYFESHFQLQLVQRLHEVIEPGGYLIVGHSDSLLRIKHPFASLGNGVYQRTH